jgi:hypothetical protein
MELLKQIRIGAGIFIVDIRESKFEKSISACAESYLLTWTLRIEHEADVCGGARQNRNLPSVHGPGVLPV